MSFPARWLRLQLRLLASIVIYAVLIVSVAALGGKFWPDYAWGVTAVFAVAIIWLASRK
ncbi:hypothetical protein MML63_21485 [Kosakonia sacchari]|uniref:hypothetical protein n=1 Tax=Kosakonia sacchari TaxID=1158459 RepID=UPI0025AFDBD9|nr:hypothetical protein [Kosakonia sacchari]MDN2488197.1 hypothetical protein [Kosakonia sacchari]